MSQAYLAPTEAAAAALFRDRQRPVMLNLLRFRAVADYSDAPTSPGHAISGAGGLRALCGPHPAAAPGDWRRHPVARARGKRS